MRGEWHFAWVWICLLKKMQSNRRGKRSKNTILHWISLCRRRRRIHPICFMFRHRFWCSLPTISIRLTLIDEFDDQHEDRLALHPQALHHTQAETTCFEAGRESSSLLQHLLGSTKIEECDPISLGRHGSAELDHIKNAKPPRSREEAWLDRGRILGNSEEYERRKAYERVDQGFLEDTPSCMGFWCFFFLA